MTTVANNNSPHLTLVEQGDTPTTPDAGKQKLFIDSADGKLKRVDESDVVTNIEEAAAGAPSDAEYLVSASSGGLSVEVVIPGLAGSPDIAGAGGAGVSYEFDSGASPLTWSPAIDVENVDSTVKSHLYIEDNSAAESLGTFDWAPAGAFDIRCKIALGGEVGTSASNISVGLTVGDSTMANRAMISLLYIGASDVFQVIAYTYASASFTQRGATNSGRSEMYLRIVRDGSNNVSFYYSSEGKVWLLIATQAFTFTAAKAGLRMAPASLVMAAAMDWLRANV